MLHGEQLYYFKAVNVSIDVVLCGVVIVIVIVIVRDMLSLISKNIHHISYSSKIQCIIQ